MSILNLTQHNTTPEQVREGVVEPADWSVVSALLTFHTAPSQGELAWRAAELAAIAANAGHPTAMIGGAPYLMAPLERALKEAGVKPVYAFSERRSSEHIRPDGSVQKVQGFFHIGWVEA